MSANEFALKDAPTDGISRVRFYPGAKRLLLASSWDKTVRLYDASANEMLHKLEFEAPVLDAAFGDDMTVVSGGLDQKLHWSDPEAGSSRVLGEHDGAVRCVEYSRKLGVAVSGSWDQTVAAHDGRADKEIGRAELPGKVLAMTLGGEWRLTVGCGEAELHVFDLRKFGAPIESRSSPLKHQIRSLATFPDNKSFAVATVEGRCAVECFADAAGARKSFAFKCHREKTREVETVYPVNALAFNPVYGTFASGGSDCFVTTWDPMNKKKLTVFHKYPTSISSLDFSSDGALLAVAVSYCFENGDQKHPKEQIMIRKVSEADVKPKAK